MSKCESSLLQVTALISDLSSVSVVDARDDKSESSSVDSLTREACPMFGDLLMSTTPLIFQDEELTAERIADLKEAFSMFDKDGDGAISAGELTTVMRSLGMNPTENEIVEIMAELDIDGSGTIELHEFVNVMLDKMQMMDTEDEIKKVFRVFDRDGNGFINAAELRYMMHHVMGQAMSEDEVDDLLKEADIDGDGQLNYEGST